MMVLVVLAGTYVLVRLLPHDEAARRLTPHGWPWPRPWAWPERVIWQIRGRSCSTCPSSSPLGNESSWARGCWRCSWALHSPLRLAAGGRSRSPWPHTSIAVFPANVYVAVAGVRIEGLPGASHPWMRLPLQAVYVAWTFWAVPGRGG